MKSWLSINSLSMSSSDSGTSLLEAHRAGGVNTIWDETMNAFCQINETEMDSSGEGKPATPTSTYLEKIKADSPKVHEHIQKLSVRDEGFLVMQIAPHLIRWSRFANRHSSSMVGEEFGKLRESIRARGGNSQAVVVRPVRDLTSEDLSDGIGKAIYEIVSGHRRHQACRELGLPVKAMIVSGISDRELVLSMYDENDARASITAFEAGTMYSSWLKEKLFSSQGKLAAAIRKQKSDVSRALFLARLPAVVCQAFESPVVLQYKDADELGKILSGNREVVLHAAKDLASLAKKKKRAEVIRLLKVASVGESVGSTNGAHKTKLVCEKGSVGSVFWDAEGMGRVTLEHALDAEGQKVFEELLSNLVKKVFDVALIEQPTALAESVHESAC